MKQYLKKSDKIVIRASRWFDSINGNTYFSAKVYVNDKEVIYLPFEYGYDRMFLQRATEEIKKIYKVNGLLRDYKYFFHSVTDGLKREMI